MTVAHTATNETVGTQSNGNKWNGKPLSLRIIGTNQGTSMDGIDIVRIHWTQEHPEAPLKMEILNHGDVEFDGVLKETVMRMIRYNETTPEEISMVNIQLGEFAAKAIRQFAEREGFSLEEDVDIIAGQGQTIWHLPLPELFEGNQIRAHLDMSEISIIAAHTGVTSMSNFRISDMALGRQGCPFFSAFDSLVASHPTLNRAVQNIGGIANITFCPKNAPDEAYDFDVGPGNVFIDGAVRYFTQGKRQYDKDGSMARAGRVNQAIVDETLKGPYFVHDIPKTTGRETFGDNWSQELCERMMAEGATPEDCVATITRITAQALVEAYERWGPKEGVDEIYLGGGGSFNPAIIDYLREKLPRTKIAFLDELGVPCSAREAADFSLKGLELIVGRALIPPKRAESDRMGITGHMQPGEGLRYHRILRHVQDFWGDYPLEKRINPVRNMIVMPHKQ
ncbi:hypothetical protein Asppvi_009325 [Aspergillus pseudoviridinutans]|uniref:Uncharacterized protein n=1 Tax=Aspergillus pseudoviridinutans TaxID=1517512 RepID=A0A9P3EW35_9EURO|nr:uncharacterized protein Asppvi_009325 [Aspergillus pseudoviridinutans]GIJ90371.1 hypothetical protein Asppvi_009325 [Aspergillus pseudoviridinutans]